MRVGNPTDHGGTDAQLDQLAINTIRTVSIDAVQQAHRHDVRRLPELCENAGDPNSVSDERLAVALVVARIQRGEQLVRAMHEHKTIAVQSLPAELVVELDVGLGDLQGKPLPSGERRKCSPARRGRRASGGDNRVLGSNHPQPGVVMNASPSLIRSRLHEERRAATIREEIERAVTVALSFPKAGRSWVCFFLAQYLSVRTGDPLDLDLLAPGRDLPPAVFLHEHIDVFEDVPGPPRLLNERLLLRRRLLVLVRDPRDSLVSYWYQKRLREARPVPACLDEVADSPV